ncbi:hypothetical protein Tco_1349194 [Tanacetum coccineum]
MTRSSTKELITPFENSKRVFRLKRRLFETLGLVESSSPELDLFSDIEEHSEAETIKIMTETMEQYMSKTCGNYKSGVVRPKINDKTHFELKGQYLKELRKNTFSGSEHEEVILFYNGLDVPTRQILDSKARSTETSDRLAAIQAHLKNLRREIKKVNEKVYAARVRCELCKGPHYIKDYLLKEEGKTLEEAYYTQFGAPYKPGGHKVLQERGIEGLPSLTEPNPRDHVKLISTAKANSSAIRRIGSGPYAVSNAQYSNLSSETVLFPSRQHGYYCNDWKEAREVQILEAYDHTLP